MYTGNVRRRCTHIPPTATDTLLSVNIKMETSVHIFHVQQRITNTAHGPQTHTRGQEFSKVHDERHANTRKVMAAAAIAYGQSVCVHHLQ